MLTNLRLSHHPFSVMKKLKMVPRFVFGIMVNIALGTSAEKKISKTKQVNASCIKNQPVKEIQFLCRLNFYVNIVQIIEIFFSVTDITKLSGIWKETEGIGQGFIFEAKVSIQKCQS